MKKAAFEIWPNFARGDLSASLQKNILNQNVLRANCFILQLKVFALLIHRLFLGLFYEFAAYSNEHRLCSLSLLGAFCSGPWLHRAVTMQEALGLLLLYLIRKMPGIGDASCAYRCVGPLPSPWALVALRSPTTRETQGICTCHRADYLLILRVTSGLGMSHK